MNELIVITQTKTRTFHAGTTKEINSLLSGQSGKAGVIDIQQIDENKDGISEAIEVNLDI